MGIDLEAKRWAKGEKILNFIFRVAIKDSIFGDDEISDFPFEPANLASAKLTESSSTFLVHFQTFDLIESLVRDFAEVDEKLFLHDVFEL